MSPQLRKILAAGYLRDASPLYFAEEIVDWAVSELVAGNITDSVSILAGLTPPYHWQEMDFYLQRALEDRGGSIPPKEECLTDYARDIAADIVSGAVSPEDGCRAIYRIVVALEYPDHLMTWLYLEHTLDDPENWRSHWEGEVEQEILKAARALVRTGTVTGDTGEETAEAR